MLGRDMKNEKDMKIFLAISKLSTQQLKEVLEKHGLHDCCNVIEKKQIDGDGFLKLNQMQINFWKDLNKGQQMRLWSIVQLANNRPKEFYSIPEKPRPKPFNKPAVNHHSPKHLNPNFPKLNIPINTLKPKIPTNVPKPNIPTKFPKPNIPINVPKSNISTNVPKPNIPINVPNSNIPNIPITISKTEIPSREEPINREKLVKNKSSVYRIKQETEYLQMSSDVKPTDPPLPPLPKRGEPDEVKTPSKRPPLSLPPSSIPRINYTDIDFDKTMSLSQNKHPESKKIVRQIIVDREQQSVTLPRQQPKSADPEESNLNDLKTFSDSSYSLTDETDKINNNAIPQPQRSSIKKMMKDGYTRPLPPVPQQLLPGQIIANELRNEKTTNRLEIKSPQTEKKSSFNNIKFPTPPNEVPRKLSSASTGSSENIRSNSPCFDQSDEEPEPIKEKSKISQLGEKIVLPTTQNNRFGPIGNKQSPSSQINKAAPTTNLIKPPPILNSFLGSLPDTHPSPKDDEDRDEEYYDIEYIKDYKREPWYKDINRDDAKSLLKNKPNGSFIIRPSAVFKCTLMLNYNTKIYNLPITQTENGALKIGTATKKTFTSVCEIIDYYTQNEMPLLYEKKEVLVKLHHLL